MYGTTAKYNKLQFAYDMMTPEDDWDSEDNELPTSSEMIAKYREVAITQLLALDEGDEFPEDVIAAWALDIAQEYGENWI